MKKIISMLGVVLFVFTITLSAQSAEMDPEAAKAYNEGNKLLKAGNFQGAVEKYETALKTSEDYRIYYQKGVTHRKLREYDKAIAAYNSALESNPDFGAAYNALGVVYFLQGDYNKAVDNFSKFAETTDNAQQKEQANEFIARSYAKLGLEAKSNGNYKQAEDYFTQAVNYDNYDAAFLGLAETYVEIGQYEKALEAADKAINNRSSISKGAAYYFKGLAFKGLDQKAKAIENFEIAKTDPQYKATSEYELDILR